MSRLEDRIVALLVMSVANQIVVFPEKVKHLRARTNELRNVDLGCTSISRQASVGEIEKLEPALWELVFLVHSRQACEELLPIRLARPSWLDSRMGSVQQQLH